MDERRGERGQVLVLAALLMTALIGFMAIVIDIGNAYAQRRFTQNAADASAIGAARHLAIRYAAGVADAEIVSILTQYLTANDDATVSLGSGLTDTEGAWYVTPNGTRIAAIGSGVVIAPATIGSFPRIGADPVAGVEVVARKQFDTFFGSVLGDETLIARSSAMARFGGVGSSTLGLPDGAQVLPMAIDVLTFDQSLSTCGGYGGATLTFALDITVPFSCHGITGNAGFNWTPLNVAENFSNAVAKELIEPDGDYINQVVRLGDLIQVSPGERAVDYNRLDASWAGRDVIVPLVGETLAHGCPPAGNCQVPIVGFAWFHVIDADGSGAVKTFTGKWVDPRTKGPLPGQGVSSGSSLWGPVTFSLTR
ncbi:MAG: hypothetical protein EPO26_15690 [Chloroflexota bacterium]|nr:MAG: hypothetical protein EPO26_15690 [Chloroflexota bacterium]